MTQLSILNSRARNAWEEITDSEFRLPSCIGSMSAVAFGNYSSAVNVSDSINKFLYCDQWKQTYEALVQQLAFDMLCLPTRSSRKRLLTSGNTERAMESEGAVHDLFKIEPVILRQFVRACIARYSEYLS